MSVIKYNKLVRDRIPEIIEASGKICSTEIIPDEQYLASIDAKMDEELAEYHKDPTLEELADLLELIFTAAEVRGYSVLQLEQLRVRKAAERGGFGKKILLKEVRDSEEVPARRSAQIAEEAPARRSAEAVVAEMPARRSTQTQMEDIPARRSAQTVEEVPARKNAQPVEAARMPIRGASAKAAKVLEEMEDLNGPDTAEITATAAAAAAAAIEAIPRRNAAQNQALARPSVSAEQQAYSRPSASAEQQAYSWQAASNQPATDQTASARSSSAAPARYANGQSGTAAAKAAAIRQAVMQQDEMQDIQSTGAYQQPTIGAYQPTVGAYQPTGAYQQGGTYQQPTGAAYQTQTASQPARQTATNPANAFPNRPIVKLSLILEGIDMMDEGSEAYYDVSQHRLVWYTDGLGYEEKVSDEAMDQLIDSGWNTRFFRLPDQQELDECDFMGSFVRDTPLDAAKLKKLNSILKGRSRSQERKFTNQIERMGLETTWFQYKEQQMRKVAEKWCREHELNYADR